MKCKDCGEIFEYDRTTCALQTICPTCTDLRNKVVEKITTDGVNGLYSNEFKRLQKTLANSHGSDRGQKAMKKFLGLFSPGTIGG